MLFIPQRFPHPTRPLQYGNSSVELYISAAIDANQDINLPGNRRWSEKPVLTIPKTFLHSLDLAGNNWVPWLRYASYAISGQSGFISLDPGGPPLSTSPNALYAPTNASIFYHPTSHVQCFIDPDLPSCTTSSCDSSRRAGFRDQVIRRDHACVWTGRNPANCDASHVIRHGKTLAYVNRLLRTRAADEAYDTIDDVRNGLLLNKILHTEAEKGIHAYVRTPIPNIINSSDLHPNCLPQQDILTAHFIHGDVYDTAFMLELPPNAYINTPGDTDTAPSHVLLDAVYGAHLFTKFGDDEVVRQMFPDWEIREETKEQQARDRADRANKRSNRENGPNKGIESSDCNSDSDLETWKPPQNFEEATPMDKLLMIRSQFVTFVPRPSTRSEDEDQHQPPSQKGRFQGKDKDIDTWRHQIIP
ncbi:hypothetical protein VNI00_014117 [Paramarasmius palmivorus]|uniref:HNH nuclease domain-containing protein n=1 Tax=Paramarasmius palmivorus TaxID=297713 RepID=A0AAW0BU59_9AGAR